MLVWRKADIQRHQTVLQQRIDRSRGLNRELRIKLDRVLQVRQALLQHGRHCLQSRRRGESSLSWRVIFLFQEREDRLGAFVRVKKRVVPLKLQNAMLQIDAFEL